MKEGPEWFAQKRYGYGAGLPIAWQGWAVLLGYVGIVAGAAALIGDRPATMAVVIVLATITLIFVTKWTTRGGWRWRWGKED